MALPPLKPLKDDKGNPMGYFEKLARYSAEYLKDDGVVLNFKGYLDTMIAFANLKEDDVHKAWELAKELNSWTEYFSSISNLIQKLYLDSDTTKIEIQAIASLNADSVKVANGDRLSNKDPNVVSARKKRNTLKAFYDELEAKIKFLERAHYLCKSTYESANKISSGSNQNQR